MPKPGDQVSAPWTGAVPAGGIGSVIRIPIPGTKDLAIELSPRNFNGKSTSTIFIQDALGKKVLRLDYGPNVKTKTIDYHWNQKGTFADFGITDHTPVGRAGAALYQGARAFKYAGRSLLVVGLVLDSYSIVVASNPLRRSIQVISAWAMAWAGAETLGVGGAAAGSVIPGLGTAAGGIVLSIAGGIGGYWAGSKIGAEVYDCSVTTQFRALPEVSTNAK
jgi:hypothetical protein